MTESLQALSNDLAALVETTSPHIVRVEARKRMPATGIVWSADGVIVTAQHVVTREENIRVGLPDGTSVPAAFVGGDPTTDIAVLKAEASGLVAARWQDPDALKTGQLTLALGRPGQVVQAALGVISAVGGEWRTHAGGQVDRYVQADVVMYPGFSGGPLVGLLNGLVGMNSSALARDISVTLPVGTLTRVVSAVLEHGRVQRAYLGVSAQIVRLPDALASQLQQETGLLLVSVEPESPADQGGLMLGDTLVALARQPVRHMDDFQAVLGGDVIGKAVPVQIVRGGQVLTLSVTIGTR